MENFDFIQKFNNYKEEIDNRLNELKYLISYNEFINKEVVGQQSQINTQLDIIGNLRKNLRDSQDFSDELFGETMMLKREIEGYKKQIQDLKEEGNETSSTESNNSMKINIKSRKRGREESIESKESKDSWITSVRRRIPKRYKYMEIDERDEKLKELFKNLNNITDIINLKEIENLYDYLKLEKFEKIYKLIPSLEELNKLIGLEKVKESVFSMICYFVHELNHQDDLNHMVITGQPGVGKTTLAKILGNIYLNMGFLKNEKFVKARRSDLIAEYLGQTATKTQKVIDSAEGGVLFIDEVYSLGNPEKRDSFAKECIDTINLNLTEKADKLLVIIAGYNDEVEKCFFKYNPGLERRFPLRFEIEKYSAEDLYKILLKFIKEDKWDIEKEESMREMIIKNYDLFKFMGGDMMVIFKYAKEYYSLRLMKTELYLSNEKKITEEDIKYSINKFRELREKKKEELPDYVKNLYL